MAEVADSEAPCASMGSQSELAAPPHEVCGGNMKLGPVLLKISESLIAPILTGVVVAALAIVVAPSVAERLEKPTCDDPRNLVLQTGLRAIGQSKPAETFPHKGLVRYDAKNLVDGKSSSAWVEGKPGLGLGSSVRVDLQRPSNVQLICVVNGYAESWALYEKNSRVRLLEVRSQRGTRTSLLLDEGSPDHPAVYQQLNLTLGTTSYVELTIRSAYSAQLDNGVNQGYADTSISEVEIWTKR
jgi:hypothetical protein